MSLHLFSIALISISSNTDSFAVAIAYGIKKVRITIGANLLIAIVSSLGTFLSMSIGEMISGYLPQSLANTLGSSILISIGIFGLWQAIDREWKQRQIEQARQQRNFSVSSYFYQVQSLNTQDDKLPDRSMHSPPKDIKIILKYLRMKQAIPLAFSLTINNVGGGIGAGIAGLNATLTTAATFAIAILVIVAGSTLGEKFAGKMTESWAGFLSSGLIILIGVYEYFN
jgi:putative sporulation protein YtaF